MQKKFGLAKKVKSDGNFDFVAVYLCVFFFAIFFFYNSNAVLEAFFAFFGNKKKQKLGQFPNINVLRNIHTLFLIFFYNMRLDLCPRQVFFFLHPDENICELKKNVAVKI